MKLSYHFLPEPCRKQLDGRVDKVSVSGVVDSGVFPSQVKPMILQLVLTAYRLEEQREKQVANFALCGVGKSTQKRQLLRKFVTQISAMHLSAELEFQPKFWRSRRDFDTTRKSRRDRDWNKTGHETFEIRGFQKVVNFFYRKFKTFRQISSSGRMCKVMLVAIQKRRKSCYCTARRRTKNAIFVYTDDIVRLKAKRICLSISRTIGLQLTVFCLFFWGLESFRYRPTKKTSRQLSGLDIAIGAGGLGFDFRVGQLSTAALSTTPRLCRPGAQPRRYAPPLGTRLGVILRV